MDLGRDETTRDRAGPLTGSRLREGVLGDRLGQGGFAAVYELDLPEGERLAVKALHLVDPHRERVQREIDLLAAVDHKNVLRYLWHESGTGHLRDYVFVATERCTGTLGDAIGHVPPGPERVRAAWAVVPRVISDAVEGIEHLHQLDPLIIHRDIKPGNLLMSPSGVWRVADLGIVKQLESGASVAPDPTVILTPEFTAPDLVRRSEISPAVDWFSLGATVQWAFTGDHAWPAMDSAPALLAHMLHHRPTISPDLPDEWRPFVSAALDTDPRVRGAWAYGSLISWQPGNLPTGQRRRPPGPERVTVGPADGPTVRDQDDSTGRRRPPPDITWVLPRPSERRQQPAPSPRAVVVRSALTFLVVLAIAVVLILLTRPR